METKNILLVPTDFTPVAQSAINHAVEIAKLSNGELYLFHVIGKEKERTDAEAHIAADAAKVTETSGVPCGWKVKEGNIFDDIGGVADEIGAHLIFMGTHGAKGAQKLFGSYALKVITNSKTPFIVVHERAIRNGYRKILVPIELSKENKQVAYGIMEMVKYFDASVHLFVKHEKDEDFAKQVANNVTFVKRVLTENNISFDLEMSTGGQFSKEVVREASKIDADLISIINLKENSLEMLGGSFEQDIIANDVHIPVMVLNQLASTVTSGFTGFYR